MLGGIVCWWLTEPTFRMRRAILSPFGVISSKRAGCGMRWGCPFKRATSAGGAGCMFQVNGMTSQSSRIYWSQCWSQGKDARRIGAIKAPPQLCEMPRCCGGRSKHRSNRAAGLEPAGDCERGLEKWAILSTMYRHDLLEHQTGFGAIVVLTQLSFAANPLFQVAY